MTGNDNYNINTLLYQNIMVCDYFKALYLLKTYHEVLQEIRCSVTHLEPWQTGTARNPSTAFCLLVKLMLMKLTVKQMTGILNTEDNVYIQGIGFLYLRYTCPAEDLYRWFEPFLEDTTEILPSSDRDIKMTLGQYLIELLTNMKYYGTTLPRIPVLTERKIKVFLLLLDEKQKRRKKNAKYHEEGLLAKGTKVRAIYQDEENEPAWYDATIDYLDKSSVSNGYDSTDEFVRYYVTFTEYGNQSCVDLGDIEYIDTTLPSQTEKDNKKDDRRSERRDSDRNADLDSRDDSRSRREVRHRPRDDSRNKSRNSRSRSNSRSRRRRSPSPTKSNSRNDRSNSKDNGNNNKSTSNTTAQSLLEKVLQSSRDASAAIGKNYGSRPVSYKGALALKHDTYTARKKSPPRETHYYRERKRSRSNDRHRSDGHDNGDANKAKIVSQEYIEKMKKLKETYGDASAASSSSNTNRY